MRKKWASCISVNLGFEENRLLAHTLCYECYKPTISMVTELSANVKVRDNMAYTILSSILGVSIFWGVVGIVLPFCIPPSPSRG